MKKQVYQLREPGPDPFLANPLIVWFTYPNGQRTVSMALVKLIDAYYFEN